MILKAKMRYIKTKNIELPIGFEYLDYLFKKRKKRFLFKKTLKF